MLAITAFSRLLSEMLGRVASPATCDRIIRRAKAQAQLSEVPGDAHRLRVFISDCLSPAIREELGRPAAAAVVEDIEAVLARSGPVNRTASGIHPAASGRPRPLAARQTIVVVNADRPAREELSRALACRSMHALGADRGRMALRLCETFRPALVVAPPQLTDMTSDDLAYWLHRRLGPAAPALVLVVDEQDPQRERLARGAAGVALVLTKPLSSIALSECIARHLAAARAAKRLAADTSYRYAAAR